MAETYEAGTGGTGNYASINGLDVYYEVHGAGEPLVLIPGGLMTISMVEPIVTSLAAFRRVIAFEPQAHGHTNDRDRPLSYEQMAQDTASLIKHLGLERADVFGFSLGGDIALLTAIRHPEVVHRIVVVSGRFRGDAEFPKIRAFEKEFAPEMPALKQLHDAYLAASPNPDGWARLVSKMRELLAEEFDWSREVASIAAPVLVVIGDADTMPPSHAVELFGLLGGGTAEHAMGRPANTHLAVLPGTTHFDILERVDLLTPMIRRFLDAPPPDAK